MFPWSFSWLPALPTIDFSLPSGIQKRFISFALRQSLGHLLKPGQLDVQQVDSQIGSGYVQVRDLELNDEVGLCYNVALYVTYTYLSGHQRSHLRATYTLAGRLRRQGYSSHPLAKSSHLFRRPITGVPPLNVLPGTHTRRSHRTAVYRQSCRFRRVCGGNVHSRGALCPRRSCAT